MGIKHLSYNKLLVIQNKLNYRPRKALFFNSLPIFFITLSVESIAGRGQLSNEPEKRLFLHGYKVQRKPNPDTLDETLPS